MADAHHAPPACFDLPLEPRLDVGRVADFEELLHCLGVRAAVRRAFERANRADDATVHVRAGGDGDTRREGAGVHAVLGQQHQIDVNGVAGGLVRLFSGEHVDEVLGEVEVLARGQGFFALADTIPGRADRRHLAGQPHRLAAIGFHAVVFAVRVVQRQRGNRRPQHRHRIGVFRILFQLFQHASRQSGLAGNGLSQRLQLGLIGQASFPQQIDHFLEQRVFGQRLNRITGVDQLALHAVYMAQAAVGDDCAFQPFLDCINHMSYSLKRVEAGIQERFRVGNMSDSITSASKRLQ